eukprot:6204015-Pleurochrysis_carterae.AAC.5
MRRVTRTREGWVALVQWHTLHVGNRHARTNTRYPCESVARAAGGGWRGNAAAGARKDAIAFVSAVSCGKEDVDAKGGAGMITQLRSNAEIRRLNITVAFDSKSRRLANFRNSFQSKLHPVTVELDWAESRRAELDLQRATIMIQVQ